MNLEHSFRYTCKDWAAMLNGVNTIKALVANIQQCAIASVPPIFDDNTRAGLANKYMGDAFEVFCEYFIKSHGASSEVGITDYAVYFWIFVTGKQKRKMIKSFERVVDRRKGIY